MELCPMGSLLWSIMKSSVRIAKKRLILTASVYAYPPGTVGMSRAKVKRGRSDTACCERHLPLIWIPGFSFACAIVARYSYS